MIDNDVQ